MPERLAQILLDFPQAYEHRQGAFTQHRAGEASVASGVDYLRSCCQ